MTEYDCDEHIREVHGILDPMYFPDMTDYISPLTSIEGTQITPPHVYSSTIILGTNLWWMFLLDITMDWSILR